MTKWKKRTFRRARLLGTIEITLDYQTCRVSSNQTTDVVPLALTGHKTFQSYVEHLESNGYEEV
ncbi:hypothetical protein HBP99_05750 [Listeria booriae]|uniref:gp45 family putative tail fiber system protein n=1 Tax=Listeria booriae TaxID=1552123 RepID=UPI00162AE029|nr:gp45 family putative tail fiber system protein [Listeria booriae]MBC2368129.1 hypothetical protein [Listeria booriae]